MSGQVMPYFDLPLPIGYQYGDEFMQGYQWAMAR